jgi:hypothetical protein
MDTAPTMEERRQRRNERNRLYYNANRDKIREKRQGEDKQKRRDYYVENKDTICENQRINWKKRQVQARVKELNELTTYASEPIKITILKLLETPESISKNDITCIKKLVEKSE